MKSRRDVFQAIADPTRRAILTLLALNAMTQEPSLSTLTPLVRPFPDIYKYSRSASSCSKSKTAEKFITTLMQKGLQTLPNGSNHLQKCGISGLINWK